VGHGPYAASGIATIFLPSFLLPSGSEAMRAFQACSEGMPAAWPAVIATGATLALIINVGRPFMAL